MRNLDYARQLNASSALFDKIDLIIPNCHCVFRTPRAFYAAMRRLNAARSAGVFSADSHGNNFTVDSRRWLFSGGIKFRRSVYQTEGQDGFQGNAQLLLKLNVSRFIRYRQTQIRARALTVDHLCLFHPPERRRSDTLDGNDNVLVNWRVVSAAEGDFNIR